MQTFDLEADGLRALNSTLHTQKENTNATAWEIINPKGSHALAVGVDAPAHGLQRQGLETEGHQREGHERPGHDPEAGERKT